MNTSGKILAAFAAGIAAGAVLGILFAPDKGSETRRKLSDRGKKMSEDLRDKLHQGKEKLDDLKAEFMQSVKEKIDEFA